MHASIIFIIFMLKACLSGYIYIYIYIYIYFLHVYRFKIVCTLGLP
jgi:hypothetical protein